MKLVLLALAYLILYPPIPSNDDEMIIRALINDYSTNNTFVYEVLDPLYINLDESTKKSYIEELRKDSVKDAALILAKFGNGKIFSQIDTLNFTLNTAKIVSNKELYDIMNGNNINNPYNKKKIIIFSRPIYSKDNNYAIIREKRGFSLNNCIIQDCFLKRVGEKWVIISRAFYGAG